MQPARSLAHTPALPGDVRLAERAGGPLELPGLDGWAACERGAGDGEVRPVAGAAGGGRADRGSVTYATALFERATVERHLALPAPRAGGDGRRRPPAGGPRCRCCRRPSGAWSWRSGTATEAAYPREPCVHELFEAQVARTPDAVAVVFEDGDAELRRAERAGQPAGAPPAGAGRGAGRAGGDLLERGPELVVGAAGRAQGGRRLRAARPGVSGRAAALHAGRQRARGAC